MDRVFTENNPGFIQLTLPMVTNIIIVLIKAFNLTGTIGIILKGPQKTSRVVFIKQVESGLMIVANPVAGLEPTT